MRLQKEKRRKKETRIFTEEKIYLQRWKMKAITRGAKKAGENGLNTKKERT